MFASTTVPVPDGVSAEDACACLLPSVRALLALQVQAHALPGESVLVLDAPEVRSVSALHAGLFMAADSGRHAVRLVKCWPFRT